MTVTATDRAGRSVTAATLEYSVVANAPPVVDLFEAVPAAVYPGKIVATLASLLTPDTVVTTDAGNFGQWAARGLRFTRPGTFLGPTSGAMGYSVPAALAARLARPDQPVVSLVGDGGFLMTGTEVETAVRERLQPPGGAAV